MVRSRRAVLVLVLVLACGCDAPASDSTPAKQAPAHVETPPAQPAVAVPPEPDAPVVVEAPEAPENPEAPNELDAPQAPVVQDAEDPPDAREVPDAPRPLPPLIATNPWSAQTFAAVWTEKTPPAEPVTFAPKLYAGVVGKTGTGWVEVGSTGELVPLVMSVEPALPLLGFWPDDAWFIQDRQRRDADFEYNEMRLMRLRGTSRWVPQSYGSHDQWFHPGTGMSESGETEYDEAHMSTRSGMLMYPGTLERITRVGGKHDEPFLGLHRGRAVDFFETGAGLIYIISYDTEAYIAQAACDDEECLDAKAQRLPPGSWRFGRRVARGKHSVSVIATSDATEFILHHRGKSGGWLLDALPAGEKTTGMWNSQEGGLWITVGDHVHWRDTESVWRDVALPIGLNTPSVALSRDGKTVWLAGSTDEGPQVFTTTANAEPPP